MWCETAQRGCEYLDQIKQLQESAVVWQATEVQTGSIDEEEAMQLAEVCDQAISMTQENDQVCSEDYCGLVGLALRSTFVSIAKAGGFKFPGKR